MLIGRDAVAQVVELLRLEDFYREAHRHIFGAAMRLFDRGDPVDLLTVAHELQRQGLLDAVGGAAYLHRLTEQTPYATNVAHYAGIVKEKALLRRLLETATQIAERCYSGEIEAEVALDQAEQAILKIAQERVSHDFSHVKPLLKEAFEDADRKFHAHSTLTGIPTGFPDLDYLTAGLQPSDLIIIAGRPSMGKSSFAVGLAQHAAIKAGVPVGIFSLEMSKEQIVQGMVCSEGKIDLQRWRTGQFQPGDWESLARTIERLYEAPIYIDDTPSISPIEMRAKARRLKAEHKVGLIVVDYLQLMRGSQRYDSRVQEVSEITRSLKSLARELNVPVVACAQLSRAVEQRPDRRPMLSDLRECVAGDTRVIHADTGAPIKISQLAGCADLPRLVSLDDQWKLVAQRPLAVVHRGCNQVFQVALGSGRTIRATAKHPFLTGRGWQELRFLQEGDTVAVPRTLAGFHQAPGGLNEERMRLLGYLIGDGGYARYQTISFTSADPGTLEDCAPIAIRQFGVQVPRKDHKRIPDPVLASHPTTVKEFLRALFSTDGSIYQEKTGQWRLKFNSTSRYLLEQIAFLLLRFDILCRIDRLGYQSEKATVPLHGLYIDEAAAQARFIEQIGWAGIKQARAWEALPSIQTIRPHSRLDRFPLEVTEYIASAARQAGYSRETLGYKYQHKRIDRPHLRFVADRLHGPFLTQRSESDLFWDEIKAIQPAGEEDVFDVIMPTYHNFVANEIVVHNSGQIEADADVVMFIYRKSYYDRKEAGEGETRTQVSDDKPDETDLIIGKQRNGPTGTVKLRFFKRFKRFESAER